MRSQFAFDCGDETLAGSLDPGNKALGVLIVTGGGQTRFGAHRGFAQLASHLSQAGFPVLRFDRRGVGDSSGTDPGFEASAPDLTAAVAAFRKQVPDLTHIIGFGLCDGATTLCLHHHACRVDAMILANPWVVEAAANEPPPAAISRHYRDQLTSFAGWKRLLTGGINYRKAIAGVLKISRRPDMEGTLAKRVAEALMKSDAPAHVVLAKDDATAIGFEGEWTKGALSQLSGESRFSYDSIDTDAHSFARDGDFALFLDSCISALQRFEAGL